MIQQSNKLKGPWNVWIAVIIMVVGQWTLPAENARILALETAGGLSHWNFMRAVLGSLTDAGHNVTAFTPFPDGDRQNYTEVDTSGDYPIIVGYNLTDVLKNFSKPIDFFSKLSELERIYCDIVFGNGRLGELMARRHGGARDFDVIVAEPMGYHCISHLANAMDLPLIYVIPSPIMSSTERTFTGHLSNPAIVPHIMAQHGVLKTFVHRFSNTFLTAANLIIYTYTDIKLRLDDPKPYDSSPTVNPSLIFQNSHYITEIPSPIVPNLIHIGGIHLKPAKSIPKDVLDFIADSPHGVILFTFGSTIRMSSLPENIEKTFKEVFAQVPQKVLWKYEGEMKDKPNNVMIRKWFPQRDILLHPKVKLFISHGGMSGVYEAVDAGVPVLGIPLFYDQPRNIQHLVHNEMAISIDLSVTKESLLNSVFKLINDEKYAKNAKIASMRFKDRPMSQQQSVVYWTEYVIRHGGAPHLKSFAHNLTWYQYFLLDVIFVMFTFIFMIVYVSYKVIKVIWNLALKYSHNIKLKSQ